jgi:hypothetical protein
VRAAQGKQPTAGGGDSGGGWSGILAGNGLAETVKAGVGRLQVRAGTGHPLSVPCEST